MQTFHYLYFSYFAIVLGLMSWIIAIPNTYNEFGSIWLVTVIINPLGVISALIALNNKLPWSRTAVIMNIILTLSVGPMWFLSDLFGF